MKRIKGGKEGLGWEDLPQKLEMVRGWVRSWSKHGGRLSSKWEDSNSVVEVVVQSPKLLKLGDQISEEEEE